MVTWRNYRYNLPVSEMIIRDQKLIGTKNIPRGHDDKQQNGPNNTNLLLESKKHFYIIDCDRKSKTSCSCNPLHDVHSKLPLKLVHNTNSKTVHCFLSEAECKRKDRFAFPSAKRPHKLYYFLLI